MADNKLYYGDNLHILRQYIPDGSVDLVYLDPPFNSNQNYNVLFKEENGIASAAQVQIRRTLTLQVANGTYPSISFMA